MKDLLSQESEVEARAGDGVASQSEAREESRAGEEEEGDEGHRHRDGGLNAEPTLPFASLRRPLLPHLHRCRRGCGQQQVGESLIMAEIEPELEDLRQGGDAPQNLPRRNTHLEERVDRHDSTRRHHKPANPSSNRYSAVISNQKKNNKKKVRFLWVWRSMT